MESDYRDLIRYVWVAYTDSVAACWEVIDRPGQAPRRQMVGFHIYGEVDSSNLRHIPLRLMHTADMDDFPNWVVARGLTDLLELPPQPPHRDVIDAWMARSGTHRPDRIVDAGPRRDHESADEFYQRVADNYRTLAADGRAPTTRLAELSGVSKGLAGKWVHEARRRGFLPPTTRGKVNR